MDYYKEIEKVNRVDFVAGISKLFGNKISDSQAEGITAIVDEFERRKLADSRYLAYILATILHETAKTMQPIEEFGKGKNMRYGKKVRYNGKPYYLLDHIYYGRGHVQVTWLDNYEKLTIASKQNGHQYDFVNHPELLLQMKPSIWATFYAMINGIYTGKRLSDYFNSNRTDWINARRIINGLDKADLIKDYAIVFNDAITPG